MNSLHFNEKLRIAAEQNKSEQIFWTGILSGQPVRSNFPYDISDNLENTYKAGDFDLHIQGELFKQLMKISTNSDHKLHVVLLSSLILLLERYSGNRDITVCTPIYRANSGGELMNTIIPIRCRVDGGSSFKQLLKETGRSVVDASKHQNYPIQLLLERQGLGTQGVYTGLMDVGLVLENVHDEQYLSRFPLNMVFLCHRTDDSIRVNIKYNARLYHQATIESIAGHYQNLLQSGAQDIQQEISRISMVSVEEKELLTAASTALAIPRTEKTLHEMFEDMAVKMPGETAIVFNDTGFTFEMLSKISDSAASLLIKEGITLGSVIGLEACLAVETVVYMLAILKAGGTILPLSPDSSPFEMRKALESAGAEILLYKNSGFVSEFSGKRVYMNVAQLIPPVGDGLMSPPLIPTGTAAYMVTHTGSDDSLSMVPIPVTHGLVVSLSLGINSVIKGNHNAPLNVSLLTSLFTGGALTHVFASLLGGHRLHIIPGEIRTDGAALAASFLKYHIHFSDASPLDVQRIISHIMESGGTMTPAKLFVHGGYLAKASLGRLLSCLKDEASGLTLLYKLPGNYPALSHLEFPGETVDRLPAIPMGKSLPGTVLSVLDRTGQPLPVGVGGELCPGDGTSGEMIRPSGHRGRRLADGTLEWLGNCRQQVIIQNVRVYPETIVPHLLEHEYILEAVVLELSQNYVDYLAQQEGKSKINADDNRLCAYYTARGNITALELHQFLAQRLPGFLIPTFCVQVEQIPLRNDHQIDVETLMSFDIRPFKEKVGPRDAVEEQLLGIWADILEKEKDTIYIDDFFFEMGGQSLKAIMMTTRIHKAFDVSVQISAIFECGTIRQLANYIKGAIKKKFNAIEAAEKKEYYLLSDEQKRLYFSHRVEMESITYNMPNILYFEGNLDIDVLESTFRELIARHESLRTSFEMVGETPVFRVNDNVNFQIEYHGWNSIEARQSYSLQETNEWNQRIITDFIRPFDLSRAPLLRAELIKEAEKKYILMIDLHHIITDRTSSILLTTEFIKLYSGGKLSPLGLQYKDYAVWQHSEPARELLREQEKFWLKELAGDIPRLDLPLDYQRPPIQNFDGESIGFSLGEEESNLIKKLAKDEGVTSFMMILAIFDILLFKLTGQEDITIATDIACRNHADLQRVVGMFVNVILLRNNPIPGKSFIDFLKEIKVKTLNAFDNQNYQLADIYELKSVKRDINRTPLFDVLFSFNDQHSGSNVESIGRQGAEDFRVRPYPQTNIVSKFDLTLNAIESREKFQFSFHYCTKLFKEETIKRFISFFESIVRSVIKKPHTSISKIEMISEEQKKELLMKIKESYSSSPMEKTSTENKNTSNEEEATFDFL